MSQAPVGEFDHELIATTAPADWAAPRPEGRYNLVVVGAGPAGLVCAVGAAALGARVALVEKHRLGGDCLHYGCVPSKALLRCSRAIGEVRRAGEFGIAVNDVRVNFPAIMERMRRLRAAISHHDAATRFRQLGIDVFFGKAQFTAPDAIEAAGQVLRFARAVVCTGARAAPLNLPGLEQVGYLTNESIFDLVQLPRRLVVIGAGPIGCELAQAFARFGSEVHVVDVLPRILAKDDPEAAELVRRQLERDGVKLHLGIRTVAAEREGDDRILTIEENGQAVKLPADALLLAAGRKANVEGLGLEAAGIEYTAKGIQVNDFLQTTNPNVYAAGDVCSPYQFTHAADAMARIVLRNALFFGRARVSRLVIPWCTYTDPEVAHIGLTPADAEKLGIALETFGVPFAEVDRAVLDGEVDGFAKVHTARGSDRILGATVVAAHAGELIGEIALAMTQRCGLGALAGTIHPYPTQAEAWKKLGDARQRRRLTPFRASVLRKLLAWRR
jgi:pyruvate/2-oxoglutarate dehydrogenase complex dihydrolipoamide dehydrogenase (E3) component